MGILRKPWKDWAPSPYAAAAAPVATNVRTSFPTSRRSCCYIFVIHPTFPKLLQPFRRANGAVRLVAGKPVADEDDEDAEPPLTEEEIMDNHIADKLLGVLMDKLALMPDDPARPKSASQPNASLQPPSSIDLISDIPSSQVQQFGADVLCSLVVRDPLYRQHLAVGKQFASLIPMLGSSNTKVSFCSAAVVSAFARDTHATAKASHAGVAILKKSGQAWVLLDKCQEVMLTALNNLNRAATISKQIAREELLEESHAMFKYAAQSVWACTAAAVTEKDSKITFEHLANIAKVLEEANIHLPNVALPVYYLLGAMAVMVEHLDASSYNQHPYIVPKLLAYINPAPVPETTNDPLRNIELTYNTAWDRNLSGLEEEPPAEAPSPAGKDGKKGKDRGKKEEEPVKAPEGPSAEEKATAVMGQLQEQVNF